MIDEAELRENAWVTEGEGISRRAGGRMMVHCFVMMFFGYMGGFVWLINLADGVLHILPAPKFDIDVSDRAELLRNTHTGPIMNSVFAMAMLLLSTRLRFSLRQAKWWYYGTIVMLWGNAVGYVTAVYAPERGLQPVGSWPNLISYATFYVAVVGATIATGICLKAAVDVAQGKK